MHRSETPMHRCATVYRCAYTAVRQGRAFRVDGAAAALAYVVLFATV